MEAIKLYRGRRKDTKEWVHGYLWQGIDAVYITPHNLGVDYNAETHRLTACAYEVEKETVSICTGFTDKIGTALYVDDILETDDGLAVIKTHNQHVHNVLIVCYKDSGAWDFLYNVNSTSKRIGNKWDNPNMLGLTVGGTNE